MGLAPADRHRIAVASHPRLSPSGAHLLWHVKTASRNGRQVTHIYQQHIGLGWQNRLGLGRAPQWSPDGEHIAFLHLADGVPHVFVVPSKGGDRRQVTTSDWFPHGVTTFEWDSYGGRIACLAPVPSDPDTVVPRRGPRRGRAPTSRSALINRYYLLNQRADGRGHRGGLRDHLFVASLYDDEPVQLTRGMYDVTGFAFSPDGRRLAYLANTHPDGDLQIVNRLYTIGTDGQEERRTICGGLSMISPVWTPRGTIVFAAPRKDPDPTRAGGCGKCPVGVANPAA